MTRDDWSARFRGLANQPFALLGCIDQALGAVSGSASTQQRSWSGLGVNLAGQDCAVPRDDVSEVISMPPLSRVPGALPWMLGVANVRGNLLPIVDLTMLYGLDSTRGQPDGSLANVLVIKTDTQQVGFRVHQVYGYREFQQGEQRGELVERAPEVLRADLLGAFVQNGEQWLALSLQHLLMSERFASAGARRAQSLPVEQAA